MNIFDLFNSTVEVDGPAGVLQVVAGVVDVDAMVLVGHVSLQLVPGVPVDPQLVVHLLQRPLHLVLACLGKGRTAFRNIFSTNGTRLKMSTNYTPLKLLPM